MFAFSLALLDLLPYASKSDKEGLKKILELLDQRCIGKKNTIFEKYKIHYWKQSEGELFDTSLLSLHTLTSICTGSILGFQLSVVTTDQAEKFQVGRP